MRTRRYSYARFVGHDVRYDYQHRQLFKDTVTRERSNTEFRTRYLLPLVELEVMDGDTEAPHQVSVLRQGYLGTLETFAFTPLVTFELKAGSTSSSLR